jgi:hypothetical protein
MVGYASKAMADAHRAYEIAQYRLAAAQEREGAAQTDEFDAHSAWQRSPRDPGYAAALRAAKRRSARAYDAVQTARVSADEAYERLRRADP